MGSSSEEYYEFADTFYRKREKVGDSRVPTEGFLELTRLCTLKCVHCYIGDARWNRDPNELKTEEVLALLDAFAAKGTLWLTLTGGEPLLRRDFPEIWKAAHQKGFLLALYTNATLFGEETSALMREYPPFRIEVSTYGATRETYERMTKMPGSYARFLRGVEQIRSLGFRWRLKSSLVKETAHEAEAMRRQAADWGAEFMQGSLIFPSIGEGESGGLAPCASRLTPEEAVEIELRDKAGNRDFTAQGKESLEEPVDEHLFSCGAGKNSFYATADGKLQMCTMTPHRAEDLREGATFEDSFQRSWQKFGKAREIKRSAGSPCRTCDLESICQVCPGLSQLETGSEEGVVEWACRQTHLKAQRLGIPHRCDVAHFVYAKQKPEGAESLEGVLVQGPAGARLKR